MTSKGDLRAGYYVVCLLDVLGQKTKMAGWATLPSDGEPSPEFTEALKDTLGVVDFYRATFPAFFDQVAQSTIPEQLEAMSPDEQGRYWRFKNCRLNIQQFSDTFVFYCPLATPDGDVSVSPVYRMLGACCLAMTTSLMRGVPMRGAICLGTGVEIEEGNFYGPGLARAHWLESEVAGYPRVIVDDNVASCLAEGQWYSDDPKASQLMQSLAKIARSLIARDVDGKLINDYLGPGIRRVHGMKPNTVKAIGIAYNFILREAKRLESEGDEKLAPRYASLRKYFEDRLHIWGIPKAQNGKTD